MADEVGRRTVPQLPPVHLLALSSYNHTDSSITNVNNNVVAVYVADTRNVRLDPPRIDNEKPGDDLAMVPPRKSAHVPQGFTKGEVGDIHREDVFERVVFDEISQSRSDHLVIYFNAASYNVRASRRSHHPRYSIASKYNERYIASSGLMLQVRESFQHSIARLHRSIGSVGTRTKLHFFLESTRG